jgi:uncharacterized FlaG/YvyC family protein
MSFDIPSVGGSAPIPPTDRTRAPGQVPTSAETDATEEPVSLDTIPAAPPPEVHDAIAVAAQAHQRLAESGRELRFDVDETTGKLSVTVHDENGNVLSTIPPSKALDVAAGGSLE